MSKAQHEGSIFEGCSSLGTHALSRLNAWIASDVNGMFYKFGGFSTLDLSIFNTHRVCNVGGMFHGCSKLNDVKYNKHDSKSN